MTRDDIIRMAKEAGWHDGLLAVTFTVPLLERFAALVAADEREACELTVDSLIISGPASEMQRRHNWAYMHARDAIRARGDT